MAFYTDQEAKEAILEVGRRMYAKNYVVSNDGNISVRVGENEIWTTPTGVCKGDLRQDLLVKVNLQGEVLLGDALLSSEVKMHLRVYKENPRLKAVTHAHPPVATSFAIAGLALDQPILPEAVIQLGIVPVAPYAMPGSQELAEAIAPFCQEYNGILLANHGALTWGDDLWQAYFRLESLEYYATISLYTGYILKQAQPLNEEALASLRSKK